MKRTLVALVVVTLMLSVVSAHVLKRGHVFMGTQYYGIGFDDPFDPVLAAEYRIDDALTLQFALDLEDEMIQLKGRYGDAIGVWGAIDFAGGEMRTWYGGGYFEGYITRNLTYRTQLGFAATTLFNKSYVFPFSAVSFNYALEEPLMLMGTFSGSTLTVGIGYKF